MTTRENGLSYPLPREIRGGLFQALRQSPLFMGRDDTKWYRGEYLKERGERGDIARAILILRREGLRGVARGYLFHNPNRRKDWQTRVRTLRKLVQFSLKSIFASQSVLRNYPLATLNPSGIISIPLGTFEISWEGVEYIFGPLTCQIILGQSREENGVRIVSENTTHGTPHPHVFVNGRVCFGNVKTDTDLAMQRGDYLTVLDLLLNILPVYNPQSPVKAIEYYGKGIIVCSSCNRIIPEGEDYNDTRDPLCGDCEYHCDNCNTGVSADDSYSFHDSIYCEDCYREIVTCCDRCDSDIDRESAIIRDDITLCHRCYENNYFTCETCETITPLDDYAGSFEGEFLCRSCFDEVAYTCECCGDAYPLPIPEGGLCPDCSPEDNGEDIPPEQTSFIGRE